MSLKTTVVGSFPKPDYLELPDWFTNHTDYSPLSFNRAIASQDVHERVKQAMKDVVETQVDLGLDIITDGEVSRENYIWHFCRHLVGINFKQLTTTVYRNGACTSDLPTIDGEVSPRDKAAWCHLEWTDAQALTQTPVKMTLPGPMTIIGTTANKYYKGRERELSEQLVACINREVLALAEAGCKYIQIDEPLLVRNPDVALQYGIEHLAQCFKGVPQSVVKTIHLCCGYPQYFNQQGYLKADAEIYKQVAPVLDNAGFDAISLEDAHRHNDLSLFDAFKRSTLILGVVRIAEEHVETVEEICGRVEQVLAHIPASRLMLAPDCGLGMLPLPLLKQKISNMVKAAKLLQKNNN